MLVEQLDLDPEIIEAFKEQGYIELHPPQAEAIPMALEGKNLVVAVPTASGKSLIGYAAALKKIVTEGRKVLYIVPLKALATEKRDDFERFAYLGFKVALSIGDLDSEDRWLKSADVIIATSEKADSLMRHGNTWINDVGLIIADEIHMMHDPSRGPTLEVALTKMRRRNPDVQIIALSATISNSRDLAQWLDADLVKSDWRPIELKEGVYFENNIRFENGGDHRVEPVGEDVWSLIQDIMMDDGQCIVFVNSRRSTEALAVRYSKKMSKLTDVNLTDEEESYLEGDSESTAVGRKLASCVKSGIAFHNAGLTYAQRQFVETNFRTGRIKCIVATPTLAAGINLPARRVVIRDTTRFEAGAGNTPIPVMEIKQMCGRAGRPGYDPYGEAVLMAKSEDDCGHLLDDYIRCDSESILSKLGNEKTLKSHILGLIATDDAQSVDDIIDFLRETFYGNQSELYGIEGAVENVVDYLEENEMVSKDAEERLQILPFGKRVSDLYIDPESAVILKEAIMKYKEDTPDIPLLHAIASTPDVLSMYAKKTDMDPLLAMVDKFEKDFLVEVPDESDYHFEYFLGNLKVAALVKDWIDEVEEDEITTQLGIGPGDIRARVDTMEWLTYAMVEIAVIFRPEIVKFISPLQTRIKYGIRSELLELVTFRGVARARARTLYDNGLKTKEDIAAKDVNDIASLPRIGNALAKSLKEQVGTPVKDSDIIERKKSSKKQPAEPASEPVAEKEKDAPAKPKQSVLFNF